MPDRSLAAALRRWDVRPRSVSATPLGTMNETFIVATDGPPLALRRHRGRDPAAIRREHEIIAHAAARGIPTPPAIATPDGELVVEQDGRCYSLFAHAGGAQVAREALTDGHARAMGATLAALHDALADYPPERCPRPTRSLAPALATTVARLEELLAIVESWPDAGEQEEWSAGHLRTRLAWIASRRGELARPAAPAAQATHGDYQEANLFFDAQPAVTAVIDWDKAEPDDPARELVRAMALAFGLDPALCAAFAAGYRSRRPMPLAALDRAAEAYSHDKIHDTWLYDTVYRRHDDRPRAFLHPGEFRPFTDRWSVVRPALAAGGPALR